MMVYVNGASSPRFRTLGTSYLSVQPVTQHWMEADTRTCSRGFRTVLNAKAPR